MAELMKSVRGQCRVRFSHTSNLGKLAASTLLHQACQLVVVFVIFVVHIMQTASVGPWVALWRDEFACPPRHWIRRDLISGLRH